MAGKLSKLLNVEEEKDSKEKDEDISTRFMKILDKEKKKKPKDEEEEDDLADLPTSVTGSF